MASGTGSTGSQANVIEPGAPAGGQTRRTRARLTSTWKTRLGSLDLVPDISGAFDALAARAVRVRPFERDILVASIADQLAAITVPRREKDRARVAELRQLQLGPPNDRLRTPAESPDAA